MLQAVKVGKHEEVQEAVREVARDRDSLKAKVSSFTKEVSEMDAQLQQLAKQKKAVNKQLAASKKKTQVCTTKLQFQLQSPLFYLTQL